jgi:hypothetical protein
MGSQIPAAEPRHDGRVLRHYRINFIRDPEDHRISLTSVPRFLEYRAPIQAGRYDRLTGPSAPVRPLTARSTSDELKSHQPGPVRSV